MPWKEFHSKIVGVTYPNDDGSSRQELLAKCGKGQKLDLALRPMEQDKNAVAVLTRSGEQLGWLSREVASGIARALRKKDYYAKAQITELTGGGWGPFKKTRGCNILISEFEET